MTTNLFALRQLAPLLALQLLAESAPFIPSQALQRIHLHIDHNALGVQLSLLLENSSVNIENDPLAPLIDSYQAQEGRQAEPAAMPAQNTLPLSEAIIWLLLNVESDLDSDLAHPSPSEYLLLGRNLNQQQAVTMMEGLRFHATHSRLSIAQTPEAQLHLFHVLHDQHRNASFLSAVAGEVFAPCILLKGFISNNSIIFLAEDMRPTWQALNYTCQFIQYAPALFSAQPSPSNPDVLAAIYPPVFQSKASEPHYQVLYLADLEFYSQADFAPSATHYARFEILPAKASQQELENLAERLALHAPEIGYRLELRPTQHTEPIEAQRNRLREELLEMEYKLAYLDSLIQPRPFVLRFGPTDLPALADLIRHFPQDVIRAGHLRYAYQSTIDQPAGWHFIYIEPDNAVMTELDSLLLWQNIRHRPTRFWLDPYWARYYHGQGEECYVFTPENTALFPAMHNWEAGQMAEYLRQIMLRWFENHPDLAELPERPIYIFDGQATPHSSITLTILDLDSFAPLHTRLGWLNDNLTLMRTLGVENIIRDMAEEVTRYEVAEILQAERKKLEQKLEEEALQASESIGGKFNLLAETMNSEIEALLKQSYQATEDVHLLEARLAKLTSTRHDMLNLTKKLQTLIDNIEKESDAAISRIADLEKDLIEPTLSLARTTRDRIASDVRGEIDALQRTRQDLERRLNRLK